MKHYDYSMFDEFISKYHSSGFLNIQRSDPFILEFEKKLDHNKQYFQIIDIIRFKLLFTSSTFKKITGVDPDNFEFGTFLNKAHEQDIERFSLARTKFFKSSHELFILKKGFVVVSANFRMLDSTSNFLNLFFQAYLFYSDIPLRTVYAMVIITDISKIDKGKHEYHFYVGNDRANFRYPDHKLLELGRQFSQREFDIIKLIADGLDSEQIAKKLFISVNTVNTHRRNVLKKTKKASTHELVIELKETGML